MPTAFSILNNSQAASALFNLNRTQGSLNMVQERINTGLKVSSAKDDASTFSVSLGMKNDVAGFKAIRETLALGEGTVSVALNATERAGELLEQLKEKVVQAQSENVDRKALQRDIDQIRNQIDTIMGSAQFNGVNLVGDREAAAAGKSLKVLSSLDRNSASEPPVPSFIDVGHRNLLSNELGKSATTEALSTIDVDRENFGKNAGISQLTADFNGSTIAAGDTVTIRVRDQEGNLYAFTMTGADTGTADNPNAFATGGGNPASIDDILAKLQEGKVQGVQTERADGTAVTQADADTITFSETGLTAAAIQDGGNSVGFTLTDDEEANSFQLAQNGVGGDDDAVTLGLATPGNASVGNQTFDAAANFQEGFERSALTIDTALANTSTLSLALTGPNGEDLSVSLDAAGGAATGDGSDFDNTGANNGVDSLVTELETAILASAQNAGLSATSLIDLGLAINQNGNSLEVVTTGTTEGAVVRGFEVRDTSAGGDDQLDLTARSSVTIANDRSFALTLEAEIAKVEASLADIQEASAVFGSTASRLEMQSTFLESLMNSLNDGVSTLVDANMAEESARLQALQVQQQLGLQALSIANQAPQAVLALFQG
ncbi:MAG: flagellin [Azospirillaceae bacterium]